MSKVRRRGRSGDDVWVVTYEHASDGGILGVFASLEEAQARYHADEWEKEEHRDVWVPKGPLYGAAGWYQIERFVLGEEP